MKFQLSFFVISIQICWLNGYNFDDSTYAVDHSTCLEYIFHDREYKYAPALSACQTRDTANIIKLNTVDEWNFIRDIRRDYSDDMSMFIGVKLPLNGNRSYDLIYEDGQPFNYTKYSILFYEDYFNDTTPAGVERVYHIHEQYLHGKVASEPYGVICTRQYNNSDLSIRIVVNGNIQYTVLRLVERDYELSLIECTSICNKMNIDENACYGVDYDEATKECRININPYYSSSSTIPSITNRYFTTDSTCQ